MSDDRSLFAIGLICTATLCFAAMIVIVKWLAAELPVVEVIWGRYFFHVALILVLFPGRVPTLLVSRRKGLQIMRSVLVLVATICAFNAITYLPIATVAAIGFVGPILVVTLAAIVLHEHVTRRRWTAVLAGFAGVLVILRPGTPAMHWAMLLAAGSALCYAIYQILTRIIRHAAPPLASLFYTALVGAIAMSAVVAPHWRTPSWLEWGLMIACGLLGGAGHFALIRAYESADASRIAPFVYSELLWTTAAGWIVFTELPDAWTFVGAAIIMASVLYLMRSDVR